MCTISEEKIVGWAELANQNFDQEGGQNLSPKIIEHQINVEFISGSRIFVGVENYRICLEKVGL